MKAPEAEASLIAIHGWLEEALAKALVVDSPDGNAIAAWVPIDRVLLARDRLALILDVLIVDDLESDA